MSPDETFSDYFLSPMNSTMRCGIFTNGIGEILIIYDQQIPDQIQWVEYDAHDNTLIIVHEEGQAQELGIAVDEKMRNNLLNATEVGFSCVQDKQIKSFHKVNIIIKDY
ncbi:MAG: hypothetical protein ACLFP8_08640 [Alphaproteobacteria bacterium]